MDDAESLFKAGREANAGQLYGFVAECGLKALLIASNVQPGLDGGLDFAHPTIPKKPNPLRKHVPDLMGKITANFQLIPDGARAQTYLSTMPSLGVFSDWSIDHRYWRDASLPVQSVPKWRSAAAEVTQMLDQAKQDGVL